MTTAVDDGYATETASLTARLEQLLEKSLTIKQNN
jgi:hypothetical protein